jgi:hypothetical protein
MSSVNCGRSAKPFESGFTRHILCLALRAAQPCKPGILPVCRTGRRDTLQNPSLGFALRASLLLSKFAPGKFVFWVAKRPIGLEQIWSSEGRPQGLRQESRKTAYPKTKLLCSQRFPAMLPKSWVYLPWQTRSALSASPLKRPVGPICPASCDAQRG